MKKTFYFKTKKDKELFENELKNNIKILLGDNDKVILDTFYDEVIKRLKNVSVIGWNDKANELNKSIHGVTEFSLDGKTSIEIFGHDGFVGDEAYLYRSFSHELWHAIIVVLCAMYKPNKSYSYNDLYVKNYSGLLFCEEYKGKTFTPGYLFNEVFVDMLSIISNNLFHDGKFTIDDILGFEFTDKYGYGVYDEFITFAQLMIAAFNLETKRDYQKRFESGNGLLGYKVMSETRHQLPANIFIDGLLRDPLSIREEFDKYMDNDYVPFLLNIDRIYFDYKNMGYYNTQLMARMLGLLSVFVKRRLGDYLEKNYISKGEYDFLLNNYNEVLECFKNEQKLLKVINRKKKYQKKGKHKLQKKVNGEQ